MPYTQTAWETIWEKVLKAAGKEFGRHLNKAEAEVIRPGKLILHFAARFPFGRKFCEEPSRVRELEDILEAKTGRKWAVFIREVPNEEVEDDAAPSEEGLNNCFFKTERTTLHDELRFRSPAEIAIYDELKKRRLLFFPNPAAVFGGKYPTKKEPDFLIFTREGKYGILEVMGATFHTNATKDHERARLFKKFGILCIEFFDAQNCVNNPTAVVDEFLALLDQH
jgi:hypothetical protein